MRTARETPIVYGLDGYWERMLGGYTPGSAVDKQVQRQDGAHVAARAMDAAKELREVKLVLGLEGPDKHVADAMRRSLMSSSAARLGKQRPLRTYPNPEHMLEPSELSLMPLSENQPDDDAVIRKPALKTRANRSTVAARRLRMDKQSPQYAAPKRSQVRRVHSPPPSKQPSQLSYRVLFSDTYRNRPVTPGQKWISSAADESERID